MKENRAVLIGLALLAVVLAVTYYLYDLERRHQYEVTEAERPVLDIDVSALEARSSGELEVTLYFRRSESVASTTDFLVSESRSIFDTEDAVLTARQVITELIKGPQGDGLSLFPEQSRVRQVYMLEEGTAVVDFSQESVYQLGGVMEELAAIRSVTRSLVENIPEIQRVKFLVGGRERSTFAGHVSISRPFM